MTRYLLTSTGKANPALLHKRLHTSFPPDILYLRNKAMDTVQDLGRLVNRRP